jgi:hypothetical protein
MYVQINFQLVFLDGCEAWLFLTFKNCEKELCFAPIQTVTAQHLTLLLFLSKNFYYFYKVYNKNTTYETTLTNLQLRYLAYLPKTNTVTMITIPPWPNPCQNLMNTRETSKKITPDS